jgi:hypothetical protein
MQLPVRNLFNVLTKTLRLLDTESCSARKSFMAISFGILCIPRISIQSTFVYTELNRLQPRLILSRLALLSKLRNNIIINIIGMLL